MAHFSNEMRNKMRTMHPHVCLVCTAQDLRVTEQRPICPPCYHKMRAEERAAEPMSLGADDIGKLQ